MYKDNQIFVKLEEGLLEPFSTTISVKQGCVLSPIIFNLYINKICSIFDQSCMPVKINDIELNCLLWADDLLLISESAEGLQNCINKMSTFYENLDLKVNIKKTKVIIFNRRGVTLGNKFEFFLNGEKLAVTDCYQYLGLKIRPSGCLAHAVNELNDKAQRAWFGISNIVHKNKRMEPGRVFQLLDSLVTPVALYGCEFWIPFLIQSKGLTSIEKLLSSWESMKFEQINQKCSRMILSVHNKSSRLAVLGELGRYPLFINALTQCLKYRISLLKRKASNPLISNMLVEMSQMAEKGHDCWLLRVTKIGLQNEIGMNNTSSKIRSKFDAFWLTQNNSVKNQKGDLTDHNKLRTYKSFKATFSLEPYI